MGEVCDFENEYGIGPIETWDNRRRASKRKPISFTLSAEEYAKYKALGGAVAMRKLIVATPIASEHPSPSEPDALAARAAAHLRLTGYAVYADAIAALAASQTGVPREPAEVMPRALRIALENLDSTEFLGRAPTTKAVIDAAQKWYLAAPPATSEDRRDAAIREAYGWLWSINTEPMAPIPMLSPEAAANKARRALLAVMSKDDQRAGIECARAAMAASSATEQGGGE
jgi:hypothetical protein